MPKGIRRTPYGWQVYAERDGIYRSRRFPPDTSTDDLRRERETLIGELRLRDVLPPPSTPARTFAQDAAEYLALVKSMRSYADRAYRIQCWVEVFGGRARETITAREIGAVLETWAETGGPDAGPLAPGTLNLRRTALMHLYARLDGKAAINPVRDVPRYSEAASARMRAVPLVDLLRVIWRVPRRTVTRARLRVLLWTGWPHQILKDLTAGDVDWPRGRVRVPARRKGRGMTHAVIPVLPPALRALRRLDQLDGWGRFSNSSLHSAWQRALVRENAVRRARQMMTLPPIRPYDIRHSMLTWLAQHITDERALRELGRTDQIARYTQAATAGRLESALAGLAVSRRPFRPRSGDSAAPDDPARSPRLRRK